MLGQQPLLGSGALAREQSEQQSREQTQLAPYLIFPQAPAPPTCPPCCTMSCDLQLHKSQAVSDSGPLSGVPFLTLSSDPHRFSCLAIQHR